MSAPSCLHCLLIEAASKATQVPRASMLREKLAASTVTLGYAGAYGVDPTVAAMCEAHRPFTTKLLALEQAPQPSPRVSAEACLIDTARAYAFGAAGENDLLHAARDFAFAEREERVKGKGASAAPEENGHD